MPRPERLEIIRRIEQKRGSKVICYVTSDRPNLSTSVSGDAVSLLHEHILGIDPGERSKIDLFLYSRGGDADVPWAIVSMFREYCSQGSFSVLIPYRAHSAATVISLGADEVVMTKKAELGPIDATIQSGPYNPREDKTQEPLPVSVEDVMGYFSLLKKLDCERPDEKMQGFEQLTAKVHPLVLGSVSRLLEQTQLVALKLLGTRAKPFSEEKNRAIIKRLSSEIFSHRHAISCTEAIGQLGLEQVVRAEDAGIEEELWELYREYRDLCQLEEPFKPEEHLVANNLDEHAWTDLKVACIESEARCDINMLDMRMRKLRQLPPQVAINLNNVAFPAVNIPNLPPNMTSQQLAQLVEQIVSNAVNVVLTQASQRAAQEMLKGMPLAGFERVALNTGWRQA